jgi:pimeloyl-ACP methyl ester carboxylesterase
MTPAFPPPSARAPLDSPPVQELLATADRGHLDVNGCPIVWARWGADGPTHPRPPIVLVHGAGAHLGWWEAVIGPLHDQGRRVVALELSGHGASGHRDAYSAQTWAHEVLSVIGDVAGGPALLVGHSLGGRVAVCAAAADPALVPRLVLVDAPVRRPGGPRPRVLPSRTLPRRTHQTLDQAVRTFRLRPREPVADAALLSRIAAAAFAEQSGGWSLRADLSVFGRIPDELVASALRSYSGPITFIYGTFSAVVDQPGRDYLEQTHAGPTELVAIKGHHHLTLDQGAEVAAVVAARHDRL